MQQTRRRARVAARQGVRQLAFVVIAFLGATLRLMRREAVDGREVNRILVIRLDLLGDVLLSMPAVEGLRRAYPKAHITMLTLPYTAPLARLYTCVDEVVEVDTNRIRSLHGLLGPQTWLAYWRVYRLLRDRHFDLALSLCGRMASLCAFLSGAKRSIGYADEAYPFLLTETVPGGRFRERMPESDYTRRLAARAGAIEMSNSLEVAVPDRAAQRIRLRLAEQGIGPKEKLVVIHAGSVNGSAKRWPPQSWARFARAVRHQTNAQVVLTGAPADGPIARQVLQEAPDLVSLVGETSVEDLVALLDRADLVATGDSGPLHLAVARGRPVLAVYGPTDPAIHGPYHPRAPLRLHRRDLPCSPCYTMTASAECPLGDPVCMRLVTVSEMVDSAVRLLSGSERN